jgi:uncharacterized protein
MKPRIIILPGNGGGNIEEKHWHAWVRDQLRNKGFEVICENMPSPELAERKIWLPHLKNKFKADKKTIIIGHSSGGLAALRYLENNKLLGIIIAGVNYTDLGMEEEKLSGYYDDPWQWGKIKKNAQWIVHFASQDDPYIPIKEQRFIHQKLDSEYHEYTDRGHFGSEYKTAKKFPEVVEVVLRKVEES